RPLLSFAFFASVRLLWARGKLHVTTPRRWWWEMASRIDFYGLCAIKKAVVVGDGESHRLLRAVCHQDRGRVRRKNYRAWCVNPAVSPSRETARQAWYSRRFSPAPTRAER